MKLPGNVLDQDNKLWVILPAAGKGTRFKSLDTSLDKKVKQYHLLTDKKTIAQYTIEQFIKDPSVAGLIVALHPEDQMFKKLVLKKLVLKTQKPIYQVDGGSTRASSVLKALDFGYQKKLIREEDWIVVHDIARPLVSQQEIDLLIASIQTYGLTYQGISLGLPITDSVKNVSVKNLEVKNQDIQTGTIDIRTIDIRTIKHSEKREQLWRSITPQAAVSGSLYRALQHYAHDPEITDEMSALERIQLPCLLVEGSSKNIKITTAEDLLLAKAIRNCLISLD